MNDYDAEDEEFESEEMDAEELSRLQEVLAADPGDLDALFELSQIYIDADRWDDAMDLYVRALAADPGNAALLNDLAVLYDDWGREEEAEDHYRQALAADPTHGPAYVNLGTLLAEQGRDEEAASILQQGMEQAADEEDRHEAELYLQELMAGDDEALEEDEDWVEDADWVEVAVVGGITLAEVIATSLRAAGIPALAYQEGAGQALGLTIGALGDASVLVPESRVDEARRLVDERTFAGLDNMGEEGEDDYLVCPHCGATLELTEEEWAQDSVVCPACDEVIDLTAYE